MRVVVSGATGFVGRALVQELVARGHHVVALSRDPDRARSTLPLIAAHHAIDPATFAPEPEALAGADAVLHLAGESVVGRWTENKKHAIRESRVLGTRALIDALAAQDTRPSILVSASAIGFYGERADDELDEQQGPGADFLATTCVEWESEAARAVDLGLRVASLRVSVVLHPEGGALQQMLLPFRLGLGGALGPGTQWWSWIHRHDLVRMICSALENPWRGSWNATAPEPVRQIDFARSLARQLGRPALLTAPTFALRALLGEFATELLTSKRVVPDRALQAGFEWEFGQLDMALADLLG
ncbi:TIGR01777 family protein [bacterium]|nr:MAG: TIGR01777 family protein [bacterium]